MPTQTEFDIKKHLALILIGELMQEYFAQDREPNKHNKFIDEIQDVVCNQPQAATTAIISSLYKRIIYVLETISLFDIPTPEAIASLQRDMTGRKETTRMRNELSRMQFIVKMAGVQKHFAEAVKAHLEGILSPVQITPTILVSPQQPAQANTTPEPATLQYIYGLQGVMNLLHCGKNKAQEIVKDTRYKEAIHRDGRKVIVNAEKLLEIMNLANQPSQKHPSRKKNTQNNI